MVVARAWLRLAAPKRRTNSSRNWFLNASLLPDLSDDLRQFAIARSIEGERYFTLAGLLGLRHVLIIGG
jgi:hypothetical protein